MKVGPLGGAAARSIAAAVLSGMRAVSLTVSADFTSGETNGRWSIS